MSTITSLASRELSYQCYLMYMIHMILQ